jgi:cullin-associated NEDD8-dissociated protein 1
LQVGAFSVLKELVVVLPDCLADHIGSLIPGIEKALSVSKLSAAESLY